MTSSTANKKIPALVATVMTVTTAVVGWQLYAAAAPAADKDGTNTLIPLTAKNKPVSTKPGMKKLPPLAKTAKVNKVIPVSGLRIGYDSVEKLDAKADLVVVAVPLQDSLQRRHYVDYHADGEIALTATEGDYRVIKVLRVSPDFEGPVPDIIPVMEPAGVYHHPIQGLIKETPDDYSEMLKGSRYLLFLGRNDLGSLSLFGQTDGKFNLDGTDPFDDVEAAKRATSKLKRSDKDNQPAATRKQVLRAEVMHKYRLVTK